jgi:hypothetical protein
MKQIFTHGDYLVEFDVHPYTAEGTVWFMPAAQVGVPFKVNGGHVETSHRLPLSLRREINRHVRKAQNPKNTSILSRIRPLLTKGN